MSTQAKIEKFEALGLGHGPIVALTIRHTFPPASQPSQSLTLELLKSDGTVSVTFIGVRELRLADIDPNPCVLKILSVSQDQWEGIRYRVFNMEQNLTLAFYCADFEFSA